MAGRALAVAKKAPVEPLAIDERIRQRAYEIYLETGRQDGMDVEHWLQAEAEIRNLPDSNTGKATE